MSAVRTLHVDPDEDGMRLDRWFRKHHPELTHGRLEKLLRTGQVRVDGGRVKASTRLAAGQAVRIPPLDAAPKPPAAAFAPSAEDARDIAGMTLYEDERILVLDKPPGLASQGGSGITRHLDGMLAALTDRKGNRPRLVHRLDRETSGVIVVAKTRLAAAELSASFRTRRVQKLYWGLAVGVPEMRQGMIRVPLKRIGVGGEDKMVPAGKDEGQHAVTRYAVLATAGKRAAFIAMEPVTGRTHQLRAHMAAIGTPLLGDTRYGAEESPLGPGLPKGLHLHARRLRLPGEGGPITVTAPLPRHMAESWAFFGFDPEADNGEFDA
ncbi:MAG: RluA family pseudouridine synthase [Alphaproteobacteria bacterium]|nr:RluA family pseudouridine synthase [Alphaproteobacteria bacterium]